MPKVSSADPVLDLWERRFNQQNERCLAELPALKEAYGIPLGPIADGELEAWIRKVLSVEGERRVARARLLLLSASLFRVQGRAQDSALWTRIIGRVCGADPAEFFLRFEQGITLFSRGDSHAALEFFAQARGLAPRPFFGLAAEINTLLCLENLGLPFEETFARAQKLAQSLKDQAVGARAQLAAFDLRRSFRRGDFRAFDRPAEQSSGALNQADYFRLWVRQLPYHSAYAPLSESEYRLFAENREYFYQNAFRLRTLQGASHPADWETLKPSEFASRFYLWVWKWLETPDRNQVRKAISTIGRSGIIDEDSLLDRESQALVRNALQWLSLFDPSSAARVRPLLDQLKRPDLGLYPVLAFESDLIHAFSKLREESAESHDFQDARDALEASPLWKESQIYFRPLLLRVLGTGKASLPASLENLGENLRELVATSLARKRAPIQVDVARFRIFDARSGEQVVSEPMAQALALLSKEVSVTQEQFLAMCFGIRRFDPLIHQTKINNLLQRLRKLAGEELRFRTKSGQVLAEGSWRAFEITRPTRLAAQLIETDEWKTLGASPSATLPLAPAPRRRAVVTPDSLRWSGLLSRSEIERKLQIPRSTTNRLLAQWERSGHIAREGTGRKIGYRRVT